MSQIDIFWSSQAEMKESQLVISFVILRTQFDDFFLCGERLSELLLFIERSRPFARVR